MTLPPGPLTHTFTAIGFCPREKLLGIAITTSPPGVGSRCPFIVANVAAISTQAYTDPNLGVTGLRLLRIGMTPQRTIEHLVANDEYHPWRQIGIVDVFGATAVVTGAKNLDWCGHVTAPGFIAMGNYLVGPQVIEAMARAFHDSADEPLEERLVQTLESGRDAGGEKGGHASSSLMVYAARPYARTDLRVDWQRPTPTSPGDAVHHLRRLWNRYRPLMRYYELRPKNPLLPSWRDWRGEETNAPTVAGTHS